MYRNDDAGPVPSLYTVLSDYLCIFVCITDVEYISTAQVYQASDQQVLQQEAYLLFYSRDPDHNPQTPPPAPPTQDTSTTPSQSKGQRVCVCDMYI